MGNEQMIGWVARVEHDERARALARQEKLLDDILSDDQRLSLLESKHESKQSAGLRGVVTNWLTSLGDRLGRKQELALEGGLSEEHRGR